MARPAGSPHRVRGAHPQVPRAAAGWDACPPAEVRAARLRERTCPGRRPAPGPIRGPSAPAPMVRRPWLTLTEPQAPAARSRLTRCKDDDGSRSRRHLDHPAHASEFEFAAAESFTVGVLVARGGHRQAQPPSLRSPTAGVTRPWLRGHHTASPKPHPTSAQPTHNAGVGSALSSATPWASGRSSPPPWVSGHAAILADSRLPDPVATRSRHAAADP